MLNTLPTSNVVCQSRKCLHLTKKGINIMNTRRTFTGAEVALSEQIRAKLIEVEDLLNKLPDNREKSIALTYINNAIGCILILLLENTSK